jgi:hypothetical protein
MLEGEEELFVDFIGRSSGRRSDGCSRAMRSGSDVDLSSSKSEFLCKRNRKEGREWMLRWIMRHSTPLIRHMREGRLYRGGEMVDGE